MGANFQKKGKIFKNFGKNVQNFKKYFEKGQVNAPNTRSICNTLYKINC